MADGDVTAGIRAAAYQPQKSPLDMVGQIVGITNDMTRNKLLNQSILNQQQELENLKTEQLGKQQEQTRNNTHFMSGILYAHNLGGANPDQINQDFEMAKTLPNADVKTITALQTHYNGLPDDQKSSFIFNLGASISPPDVQQKIYGTTVKATDAQGRDVYYINPNLRSPIKQQQVGGPIGGGVSAEAGAQPVTVAPDATGAPQVAPLRSTIPAPGGTLPPTTSPAPATTSPAPATTSPAPVVPPAVPPPTSDQPYPPPASQQPVAGQPPPLPGQRTTGLPSDWDWSVGQGKTLNTRADQVSANKSQLTLMKDDLARINTGPTADREKNLNAFVQKYAGFGITMNQAQIAATEGFNKIATQIAISQAAQAGETDLGRMNAMMANPNLDLSKLGNEEILARLQGNEDFIAAKNKAWNQWKQGRNAGSYAAFSQDFNNRMSPLVFQHEQMTVDDRKPFRASLSKQQEDTLFNQRDEAIKRGWLRVGGG